LNPWGGLPNTNTPTDASSVHGATPGYVPPVSGGPMKWVGALVAGVLFLIIGIVQAAVVSSWSNDSMFPDSGFSNAAAIIPVFTILIGVILVIVSFVIRGSEITASEARERAVEEQRIEQERLRARERQEMVNAIKSTVMVRCEYCGTLNEESAPNCKSCGANL
jgi:zinc-ribbon domain